MRSATNSRIRSEKIVLIGSSSVGKTSILNRFIRNSFSSVAEPTIGASFLTKVLDIEGSQIKLDIWDTGGSEKYKSLTPMYYRDASLAILVIDITNEDSLIDADEWFSTFKEKGPQDAIVVCAANKCDLESNRKISKKDAEDFVFKNQIEIMVETSAMTGAGIKELFAEIGKILLSTPPRNSEGESQIDFEEGTEIKNTSECTC